MSTMTATAPATPILLSSVRWRGLVALLVASMTLLWVVGGLSAGRSQAAAPLAEPITVVVQPGDTVWALAADHAPPGTQTMDYAARVIQLNRVDAGALQPGTVLLLPQD